MTDNLAPIADVITLVANDQAGEASGLVHDLLGARVLDALQSHKQEIAQTLFAPSADALAEGNKSGWWMSDFGKHVVKHEPKLAGQIDWDSAHHLHTMGHTPQEAAKRYVAVENKPLGGGPWGSVLPKHRVKEEVEQLDELSGGTLRRYVVGAAKSKDVLALRASNARQVGADRASDEHQKKSWKRTTGIKRAVGKLGKYSGKDT